MTLQIFIGVDDPNYVWAPWHKHDQPVYGYDQPGNEQDQPGNVSNQPKYKQDQPVYGYDQLGPDQPPVYDQTNTDVVMTQPSRPACVISTASPPPDYMMPSIFACLCCCCPAGLIAIYFALQTNGAVASGDLERARTMSSRARIFMIISVIFGIFAITLVIALRAAAQNGY